MHRILEWIDDEAPRMGRLVEEWAAIPSESHDLEGLDRLARALARAFASLGGPDSLIPLPPARRLDASAHVVEQPLGAALRIVKRDAAPRRIFLGIHMDTVHSRERAPRLARDGDLLRGPGVADAKGGIAVLLVALEAFERSEHAERLGWEVLINPDEELGSPGSSALLHAAALRNDAGLVFEPALPGGALAAARKGSATFSLVVHGRAAHVGRDFSSGRNAITAAARAIGAIDRLNGARHGMVVNVGEIAGGGKVNVVPDLAIARVNTRFESPADATFLEAELRRIALDCARDADGLSAELDGGVTAPPKPLDPPTLALLEAARERGRALGLAIDWQATGGVSDGNRLAAAGLPTLDTLGPRGGGIHSADEHVFLDSLPERAKLSALLLLGLATGEIELPKRHATARED